MPVVSVLAELDDEALLRILVEPKNALVKQYKRLLELDKVQLRFTSDALRAIASLATSRNAGARGLRAILEDVMLDIMFDIPSNDKVEECVITKGVVVDNRQPTLVKTKAG